MLTGYSEYDITDVIEETFTTTEGLFGEMQAVELKPDGADIAVTEENKQEYVDLIVDYRVSKRINDQLDALMSGINEIIPLDLFTVFDERELELLIAGTPEIDVYVLFPITCMNF
jgi:E3 ubiquitin-protein ligase NEDD4